MSARLQLVYSVFVGLGTVASLWFQWRRETRDTKRLTTATHEDANTARKRLRSDIVELLYHGLLPMRLLFVHLGTEERLKKELEWIIRKPEIMQTLAELLAAMVDAEKYPLRLRRIQRFQTVASVLSTLSTVGVLLPLVSWFMNEPVKYHLGNWIMLAALGAAFVTLVIATTFKSRYQHRMNLTLYSGAGTISS